MVILFLIVLVGVLAFPHVESMLPDDVRWQIETGGGLFAPANSPAPLRPPPRRWRMPRPKRNILPLSPAA